MRLPVGLAGNANAIIPNAITPPGNVFDPRMTLKLVLRSGERNPRQRQQ